MWKASVSLVAVLAVSAGSPAPLSAQATTPEGQWAVSFDLPQGPVAMSLALMRDDERWTGAAEVHVGPSRVTRVDVEGRRVTVRVEVEFQDQWYAMEFAGELENDEIDGSVSLPDGNRTAFRAVRSEEGMAFLDRRP